MNRLALTLALFAFVGSAPSATMAHEDAVPTDPMDVRPLTEGMPVPDGLVLHTRAGESYPLSEALRAEPTVLLFYRGGW